MSLFLNIAPFSPFLPQREETQTFKMMPKGACRDIGVRGLVTLVPSMAVATSVGVINCQPDEESRDFDA